MGYAEVRWAFQALLMHCYIELIAKHGFGDIGMPRFCGCLSHQLNESGKFGFDRSLMSHAVCLVTNWSGKDGTIEQSWSWVAAETPNGR